MDVDVDASVGVDEHADENENENDVDDVGQASDGEGGQVNEEVDVFGDLICTSSDLKFGKSRQSGLASVVVGGGGVATEALHCVDDVDVADYCCCGCGGG